MVRGLEVKEVRRGLVSTVVSHRFSVLDKASGPKFRAEKKTLAMKQPNHSVTNNGVCGAAPCSS